MLGEGSDFPKPSMRILIELKNVMFSIDGKTDVQQGVRQLKLDWDMYNLWDSSGVARVP